jgi:hypothetical protein
MHFVPLSKNDGKTYFIFSENVFRLRYDFQCIPDIRFAKVFSSVKGNALSFPVLWQLNFHTKQKFQEIQIYIFPTYFSHRHDYYCYIFHVWRNQSHQISDGGLFRAELMVMR